MDEILSDLWGFTTLVEGGDHCSEGGIISMISSMKIVVRQNLWSWVRLNKFILLIRDRFYLEDQKDLGSRHCLLYSIVIRL